MLGSSSACSSLSQVAAKRDSRESDEDDGTEGHSGTVGLELLTRELVYAQVGYSHPWGVCGSFVSGGDLSCTLCVHVDPSTWPSAVEHCRLPLGLVPWVSL